MNIEHDFRQHGVHGMGMDSIVSASLGLHVLDHGIRGVLKS